LDKGDWVAAITRNVSCASGRDSSVRRCQLQVGGTSQWDLIAHAACSWWQFRRRLSVTDSGYRKPVNVSWMFGTDFERYLLPVTTDCRPETRIVIGPRCLFTGALAS